MLRMLLSFTLGWFTLIGYPSSSVSSISDEQVVENYVEYFHRNMRYSYTEKAKRLIPVLLEHSSDYQVDPLLMGCIFSFESSWRNFLGRAGERGPGHVMPEGRGLSWRMIGDEKIDLTTLDGQIKGACAHMRVSMNTCKKMEGVFSHYAGAGCKSSKTHIRKKMRRRARYYKTMVKKFRGHNDISLE